MLRYNIANHYPSLFIISHYEMLAHESTKRRVSSLTVRGSPPGPKETATTVHAGTATEMKIADDTRGGQGAHALAEGVGVWAVAEEILRVKVQTLPQDPPDGVALWCEEAAAAAAGS